MRRLAWAKKGIDFGSAADTHLVDHIYPHRFLELIGQDAIFRATRYPGLVHADETFQITVAKNWSEWFGIPTSSESVVVLPGAYGGYRILSALVPSSGVVLIPSVMHQQHVACLATLNRRLLRIKMNESGLLDLGHLEALLRKQTNNGRLCFLYLNHTFGSRLTAKYLKQLAVLAERYSLTLWYDADTLFVSHQAAYDPTRIFANKQLRRQTIFLGTLSKEFNLPGLRIGYAIAPVPIATAMRRYQEITMEIHSPVTMYVATQALQQVNLKRSSEILNKRMEMLVTGLRARGWKIRAPYQGINLLVPVPRSFQVVRSVAATPGELFAFFLLKKTQTLVRPGSMYGLHPDLYVRFVVSQHTTEIQRFFERLDAVGIHAQMSLPSGLIEEFEQTCPFGESKE
mgnify:FL=1